MTRRTSRKRSSLRRNSKTSQFGIYDNGGKTADRYTILYRVPQKSHGESYYVYFGMDEHPNHPQGFGQHGELPARAYRAHQLSKFRALGKPIKLSSLPAQARKAAERFMLDCKE